jgi:hypothetical protein
MVLIFGKVNLALRSVNELPLVQKVLVTDGCHVVTRSLL